MFIRILDLSGYLDAAHSEVNCDYGLGKSSKIVWLLINVAMNCHWAYLMYLCILHWNVTGHTSHISLPLWFYNSFSYTYLSLTTEDTLLWSLIHENLCHNQSVSLQDATRSHSGFASIAFSISFTTHCITSLKVAIMTQKHSMSCPQAYDTQNSSTTIFCTLVFFTLLVCTL